VDSSRVRDANSSHTTASAGAPSASSSARYARVESTVSMKSRVIAPRSLTPSLLEPVDNVVGRLASDVGGDLVPAGIECRVAVKNEMRHAGVSGQKVDHRLAQFGGRDHPQMQHGVNVNRCG
jgi:hypothetical protein